MTHEDLKVYADTQWLATIVASCRDVRLCVLPYSAFHPQEFSFGSATDFPEM